MHPFFGFSFHIDPTHFCLLLAYCESLKDNRYAESDAKAYFWRTTQQQEIDFIEEADGVYHLFEFKWNTKKQARFSKTFLRSYDVASMQTVHPGNVEGYVL